MQDVYEPCPCGSGKKYKFCCYQKERTRRWSEPMEELPTVNQQIGAVVQLKVTLLGSEPPIWRRILVRSNTTLGRLHDILQTVMGWDDDHLHEFMVGGARYGVPDPGVLGFRKVWDEHGLPLHVLVQKGIDDFTYEYDFGDGWEHEIVIEKHLDADPKLKYPVCVEGERACPPEDCGGIPGFYSKLEALKNRDDEEYEDIRDWMGDFDPEKFSVRQVNRALHH
jgi:hypothetical protein